MVTLSKCIASEIPRTRSGRADSRRQALTAEGLQRMNVKLLLQQASGSFSVKRRRVALAQAYAFHLVEPGTVLPIGRWRKQNFPGIQANQLIQRLRLSLIPLKFGNPELSGGDFEHRQSDHGLRLCRWTDGNCGEEVRFDRRKKLGFDERAGRIQPDDFAAYQPFGVLGVFDLLAQGHRPSGLQQLGDIAGRGVVGHAAERDRIRAVLVAGGQRDGQNARCFLRILIKHFVEITHPEKQDRMFVAALDLGLAS
jgi:hypothetical protein